MRVHGLYRHSDLLGDLSVAQAGDDKLRYVVFAPRECGAGRVDAARLGGASGGGLVGQLGAVHGRGGRPLVSHAGAIRVVVPSGDEPVRVSTWPEAGPGGRSDERLARVAFAASDRFELFGEPGTEIAALRPVSGDPVGEVGEVILIETRVERLGGISPPP